MRKLICCAVVLSALLTLCLGAGPAQAGGLGNGRYFPETGQSLSGGFYQYWNTYGNFATFGVPITAERVQHDAAGRSYREQYLVNAVFEYHADLPAGRQVVLAPLGRLRYAALYPGRGYATLGINQAAAGAPARYFAATGAFLGGGFLTWWSGHQGTQTLGQPITGEFGEADPTSGRTYTVQYFEYGELQSRPAIAPLPLGRLWLNRRTVASIQPLPPAPPPIPAPPIYAPPIYAPPVAAPVVYVPPVATPPVYVPPPPAPFPILPPPSTGGGITGGVPPLPDPGMVGLPPVGEVLTFVGTTGQGQLRATVLAVQEAGGLNGNGPPAGYKFVTIVWRVSNIGTAPESVGSRSVALRDGRGRLFAAAVPEVQNDARAQYGRAGYFTAINPTRSDDELITFVVPTDVTSYDLVPAR
ncbi:MAG: DUF4352 domain-containing protein [Chloroflexota bacterium]|nr:DUF4352 domain-containing protein [Chloroflexota bacterium]